jgi:putative glutathione S-transferase
MAAPQTAVSDTTADGAFRRQPAVFRERVSQSGRYPPEGACPQAHRGEAGAAMLAPDAFCTAGRYVLYVSLACPWASRCVAVRSLKGLESAIELVVTHPVWARTRPGKDEHCGWQFRSESDEPVTNPAGYGPASTPASRHGSATAHSPARRRGSFPCDGCTPDPVAGVRFVRDLYELAGATGEGVRFTVPILFDKATKTIVSNESSDIVRMLNSEFNAFASAPELDLYPEALRPAIDEVNSWVYDGINNGVYRCGFASSQTAYEEAFHLLYASLERVESILRKQRYIAGSQLTEADVRLFVTLIRYDEVYAVYFKTNGRLIREMPNTFA